MTPWNNAQGVKKSEGLSEVMIKMKSLFIKNMFLFKDESLDIVKILDYILTNRELSFTMSDIEEQTNIKENTALYWIRVLENSKMINFTGRHNKENYYNLNLKNMCVKNWITFFDSILSNDLSKEKGAKS